MAVRRHRRHHQVVERRCCAGALRLHYCGWSAGWRQLRAHTDAEFREAVEEANELHATGALFARQIELAEASDDDDDAPMPDAPPAPEIIDMPPAPASARPMSNLERSNSNKCGCGMPAQAKASARVDVSTARAFPTWTMESNMSASFCTNAWTRARRATDRDLESFYVNAWICAQSTTDRDVERVSTWCRTHHTTHTMHTNPHISTPMHHRRPTMILHSIKFWIICNVCNFMRIYCFWKN